MKKAILLLSLMALLFSCRKYRLSESDLEWQPYEKGDKLVFESTKGELDTIQIESIEEHINPDDPLAIFPNMIQSLFVLEERAFLQLRAGEKETYIHFEIHLGKNKFNYPRIVKSVNELNQLKKTGTNKYIIKAEEYYYNLKGKDFDLRYIHWDKEYGYIKLEFEDSYSWHLKSFLRNGVNRM